MISVDVITRLTGTGIAIKLLMPQIPNRATYASGRRKFEVVYDLYSDILRFNVTLASSKYSNLSLLEAFLITTTAFFHLSVNI